MNIDNIIEELEHRQKAARKLAALYGAMNAQDSKHYHEGVVEGIQIAMRVIKETE